MADPCPVFDTGSRYVKQTLRNRCYIATEHGSEGLTVPVSYHNGDTLAGVVVSPHNRWWQHHWQALETAYGQSPFFRFYAPDLERFFLPPPPHLLLAEYNIDIIGTLLRLMHIESQTPRFNPCAECAIDVHGRHSQPPRYSSCAGTPTDVPCEQKNVAANSDCRAGSPTDVPCERVLRARCTPTPAPHTKACTPLPEYQQVFHRRYPFIADLSILDLLFCLGPEATTYLCPISK